MSSVIEILQLYGFPDREVHDVSVNVAQNVQSNLIWIKQNIINALQIHQMNPIWYNMKLLFYSSFKTTQSISIHLDLVNNMQHRQAVAKLRSGNHDLRIETGRHCVPKTPVYPMT